MNRFYEVSEFVVLRWLCGFVFFFFFQTPLGMLFRIAVNYSLVDLLDIPALARNWIIWVLRFAASFLALSLEENEVSRYFGGQQICLFNMCVG